MKIYIFSSVLVAMGCLICSCLGDLNSSLYGRVAIKSPNGEELFFREEARGLSFDQISLSTNKNYCSAPNPSSDIIFQGDGVPLFYKFEGESLHLYTVEPLKVPENFSSKIKIVVHQLNNLDLVKMKKTYKNDGLSLLDRFYDESLKC